MNPSSITSHDHAQRAVDGFHKLNVCPSIDEPIRTSGRSARVGTMLVVQIGGQAGKVFPPKRRPLRLRDMLARLSRVYTESTVEDYCSSIQLSPDQEVG